MAFEVIQGFNVSKNEAIDPARIVAATEADMLAIKWVYDGLRVTRLDTTPHEVWICTVTAATQPGTPNYTELADWEEFTGTAGTDGVDGSQIYTAAGDPSDVLGVDGDFYINSSSGDYFTKAGGTWGASAGNLVGPQGGIGNTGPAGNDGDTYASTSVTSVDLGAPGTTEALVLAADTLDYTPGQDVVVASDADPLVDNFTATVISYVSFTLTVGTIVANGTLAHTDWSVNLTGSPGQAGDDGADGADGVTGNALIHNEFDITLNDAKVTAVQGGAWTPQVPWSASVQTDSRSNLNSPSGIIGTQAKNSITYNGTVWSNNGRWVGQDGTNGTNGISPYIQSGNWYDSGGDTGVPAQGPKGDDGDGIIEYNYQAAGSLTASSIMALPFNFYVPCRLNITMARGSGNNYVELPNLNVYSGRSIRSIRVSQSTPRAGYNAVITIRGRYNANALQTFPHANSLAVSTNYAQLGIGESGIFEPVLLNTGNHDDYWLGQISGRGLELYTKARDYGSVGSIKIGEAGLIKGFFSFRVNNGVCHYGGYFRVVGTPTSTGVYTDHFPLGPEIPWSFLPDPVAGPAFNSSSGLPPGNGMFMPLSVNGASSGVFSWVTGFYQAQSMGAQTLCTVALNHRPQEAQTSNQLAIQVRIDNPQVNWQKIFTFGGSYNTASPKTAATFYNI